MNIKRAMKEMIQNMDMFAEWLKATAKMQKLYYDTLVAEGFSREEAVKICGSFHPLNYKR